MEPKRILVTNTAHIGDLIMTTAVLPVLKSAFPGAEIGMLIGTWSLPVIENHTLVDHIHIFDHPRHNRSTQSRRAKRRRGSRTWRKALQEVKEKEYDLAFDMYSLSVLNAGKFLYQAETPERVGFWFSPNRYYYTHEVMWSSHLGDRDYQLVEIHGALLREFGIGEEHLAKLMPTLTYRNEMPSPSLPDNYVVVHMGVGEPKREWNRPSWKELVHKLDTLGLPLVFVGRGVKEREEITHAIKDLKGAHNFCDKLSWRELIPLIGKAKLLVGLESMAGHMAAVTQTPAVLIYGGTAKVAMWRPFSPICDVVIPPAECFDEKGKVLRTAIHKITAEDVFEQVKKRLAGS